MLFRSLKHGSDEVDGALPQVLSKLYHLQVLSVGSYTDSTIPEGINNLVSLRHLIVHKENIIDRRGRLVIRRARCRIDRVSSRRARGHSTKTPLLSQEDKYSELPPSNI